jgi:hypothetical protein
MPTNRMVQNELSPRFRFRVPAAYPVVKVRLREEALPARSRLTARAEIVKG